MSGLIARTPLVGRSSELASLRPIVDALETGQGGRVIFVAGQPGVGKTRLAHELAAYVHERRGLVAEGRYLPEGNPPYGPWVHALRTVLRVFGDAQSADVVDPYRTELAVLLPELAPSGGTALTVSELAPDERHRRLYEAVTHVIDAVSQQSPLMLLLDDVQWAPGLTLLAHVARNLPRCRALLVCCYRDDEFKQKTNLLQTWGELNRSRLSVTINLQPLAPEGTIELLQHHVGTDVARRLAGPVHRRATGNPFFTEEVLQTLMETGAIRAATGGWQMSDAVEIVIPESIKLAILERVERHGQPLHTVLTHAAVLGQEFSFEILRQWTGIPEDGLVRVIELAIASRLLIDRSESGEELYAFADDQIQEVLYASIPLPTRRRLHVQAAFLLEERTADRPNPPVEQLARHFLQGANGGKGAEYAARAGRKSASLFNWAYAVDFYDKALRALVQQPDSAENRRKRVDLVIDRISVSFGVDPSENLGRLEEALRLVRPPDQSHGSDFETAEDRSRMGRVLYWLGRTHVFRNEMEQARAYLEHSRAVLEPTSNTELLALPASAMGRLSHAQGRFGQCVSLLSGVLKPLERSGNWSEWIASQGYLGAAQAAQDAYAIGLAAASQALERAQDIRSLTGETLAEVCLACVHLHGNDMRRMLVASRDAVQAAHRSGDRLFLYQALMLTGWAESRLGDQTAAATSMDRANELLASLGGRALFSDWHAAANAEVALNVGDIQAARERALYALEVARSMQGLFSEGIAHRALAMALEALEPGSGQEHLRASLEAFEAGGAVAELRRTASIGETPTLARRSEHPDGLTSREVEVLRLLARGCTNREIAAQLVISPTTVDRHISNMYSKIGAHGRAEAATYALAHGLMQRH